jgi:hypothetical protein
MTNQRRWYFDTHETHGIEALIHRFPKGAFASPFRSTVPFFALAKDAWPTFAKLVSACDASPDFTTHFEFKVAAPGVKGNPSHTDAMIVSPTSALAIEAKWTEPRYKTVSKHVESRVAQLCRSKKISGLQNDLAHRAAQRAIVEAWLSLIKPITKVQLDFDDVQGVVYQMIHRAASACALERQGKLAYLHFQTHQSHPSESASATYRSDLTHLFNLLGKPENFPFYLVEIRMWPTPAFERIKDLPRGEASTHEKVRRAILESELFEFDEPKVEKLGL